MLVYMGAYIIMIVMMIVLVIIAMYNLKKEKVHFRLLQLILLALMAMISLLLLQSEWCFSVIGHNAIICSSIVCLVILAIEGR